jgi:MFS family permease
MSEAGGGRRVWDLTGYQWTVVFAAWLGWGFDVFDGLLFNFVAPNCVPTLLGLPIGSPDARSATLFWTGVLTSLLLIGWAIGGTIFGKVADRLGRTRTLLLTMLIYSIGTALCAVAPNIWMLAAFRFVASLGIGGEWAAGASVAEVVPEAADREARSSTPRRRSGWGWPPSSTTWWRAAGPHHRGLLALRLHSGLIPAAASWSGSS